MNQWNRTFSTSCKWLKKTTFDKGYNVNRTKKPWETSRKKDKATWFKDKYAHVHAKQKENPRYDQYGKKAAHVNKLKEISMASRTAKVMHRRQFSEKRITDKLEDNPLLECIFGTNNVMAALMNKNREYYTRLLYHGNNSLDLVMPKIKELGLEQKIQFQECDKHELNVLSKFNLHNNIILETKPLEILELNQLGIADPESKVFNYDLVNQDDVIVSKDDPIRTIQKESEYTTTDTKKYPLGLYLDEVMDPHNVGAIIRSAYYLGVDFIVMSRQNSSRLSPVVSKASSGAMEFIPIYHVDDPVSFFKNSRTNGWTFVTSHCSRGSTGLTPSQFVKDRDIPITELDSMLQQTPTMLVLGNEGAGVRSSLRQLSDYFVEIPFSGPVSENSHLVDSLNVSVAAAILMNHLLPCQ